MPESADTEDKLMAEFMSVFARATFASPLAVVVANGAAAVFALAFIVIKEAVATTPASGGGEMEGTVVPVPGLGP